MIEPEEFYNDFVSRGIPPVAAAILAHAEMVDRVATQVSRLGTHDAGTQMGAIEYLAATIKEALGGVSYSLEDVANATREVG